MLKSLSTSLPFYGFKTHSPEMLEWGMEKQKGLLRILTIPNHLRTTMHLWPESGYSNLTGMLLPLWDVNNIMMQKFQTFNYSELRGMNLTSLLMWTCNIKFENTASEIRNSKNQLYLARQSKKSCQKIWASL